MMKKETKSGEIIDVLPVNTRVRHKTHPELTGRIVAHEYHESGYISPLPYKIYWDQGNASEILGFFFIYPSIDSIEKID
jgi:hypothetical protein